MLRLISNSEIPWRSLQFKRQLLKLLKELICQKTKIMALKGNKGEWSELYAFFKLLSDGCIYCGDAYLNRYDDKSALHNISEPGARRYGPN